MTEQEMQVKNIQSVEQMLRDIEGATLDFLKKVVETQRQVRIVKDRIESGRQSDHKLN
jgi:hypothetical protein